MKDFNASQHLMVSVYRVWYELKDLLHDACSLLSEAIILQLCSTPFLPFSSQGVGSRILHATPLSEALALRHTQGGIIPACISRPGSLGVCRLNGDESSVHHRLYPGR